MNVLVERFQKSDWCSNKTMLFCFYFMLVGVSCFGQDAPIGLPKANRSFCSVYLGGTHTLSQNYSDHYGWLLGSNVDVFFLENEKTSVQVGVEFGKGHTYLSRYAYFTKGGKGTRYLDDIWLTRLRTNLYGQISHVLNRVKVQVGLGISFNRFEHDKFVFEDLGGVKGELMMGVGYKLSVMNEVFFVRLGSNLVFASTHDDGINKPLRPHVISLQLNWCPVFKILTSDKFGVRR